MSSRDLDKDPWALLEMSESTSPETTSKDTAAATKEASSAPQGTSAGKVEPNSFTPAGIALAHAEVSRRNHERAAKQKLFVLDDVLPMSFVPPPSWGAVRTRWQYRYKGLPVESLTFENDKTIRRATVRVHGRD